MKRLLDIVVSIFALIVLSPLLLLLSAAVALALGRPVLFRQRRAGMHGRPFEIVKFRTMTDEVGTDGRMLPDDRRLTPFGRMLRASSLDELPELFNVLRGDMSLVGPRPLLLKYMERYSPEQARRHDVLPGLTGWAQVCGRNSVDWEDRLRLDVWYVDNRSLWLDARIVFKTFGVLLDRRGIAADGHATMPEFLGSRNEGAA